MTTTRVTRSHLAVVLLALLAARPGAAQQPTVEDLKKELDALKGTVTGLQKEIQDLRAAMARATPPSGLNVSLDLGKNPVKGEQTAKLTLVEFSDYQ